MLIKFNYFKKQHIKKNFIPWLKNETKKKIIINNITDQLVDRLILNTVTRKNIHTKTFRETFEHNKFQKLLSQYVIV